MTLEEFEQYQEAIGLWIEFHGSIDSTVSDTELWAFYESSKVHQQDNNVRRKKN